MISSLFIILVAGFTRLQTLIEAVSLRRTKSDQVNGRPLVALPKKKIRMKKLTFTTEERQIYDCFFAKFRVVIERYARRNKLLSNYAHVFVMMMRLRQLSCHRELYEDFDWDNMDMDDIARQAEQIAAEREGAKAVEGAKAAGEAEAKRLAESLRNMIRDGATDDCSICVSDLTQPVITPCAHVFCLNCITRWLEHKKPSPGCPLCRLPVDVKNLLEAAPNNEEEVCDGEESDDEDEYADIVVNVSSTKINAVLKVRHIDITYHMTSFVNNVNRIVISFLQELAIIRKENPKTKTVVVSQFTSLLSMLQPLLKDEGFRYTRLDGTMNTRARSDVISEFQDRESSDGPTVLLLSLRAGGVGLNLTSASRDVVHSDFLQFSIFTDRCHFIYVSSKDSKPV